MSINAKIKDAQVDADKWRDIVSRGTWRQWSKTEIQAMALMHYHEGRLEAFTEAKLLIRGEYV